MNKKEKKINQIIFGAWSIFATVLLLANYFVSDGNVYAESITREFKANTSYNIDGNSTNRAGNSMWIGTGENIESSYAVFKFDNVVIPKGAEIKKANFNVRSTETQWLSLSFSIIGKRVDQSYSPDNGNINENLVSSSVNYSSNERWNKGKWYKIGDVKKIIEEITSDSSWQSGNSIVIVAKGTGSQWGRKSINGSGSNAAKLTVELNQSVSPTPTPTPSLSITPTPTPTPTNVVIPVPTPIPTVSPTVMPTPMPTMTQTGSNSMAMGLWTPSKWDTCSKASHDSFSKIGPDGKKYPTWHPPSAVDPATGKTCNFGHEHGRNPEGSDLNTFINQQYGGILFGYANEKLDEYNISKGISNGMRHEDHVGHKIEWENNVRLNVNQCNRPASIGCFEFIPTNVTCDFLMKVHQGTHSKDAFANNVHELAYFVQCSDGTKIAATKMVPFGTPGEFMTTCDKNRTIRVGGATPSNSPTGGGVRFISDLRCVDENIYVPSNQFSNFSLGLYEDWVSSNYLVTSGGRTLAYFDPHFAVFTPSRYYDPTKPDNVGRSIDLCYGAGTNGEKARGGECDVVKQYSDRITYDDPRSPMNGVHREFYFNQTWIDNEGGPTTWYTDPYGGNASTSSFVGAIRQYISSTDNYNKTIYESQAIGSNRYYGGNGVHAPN